MSRQYIGARYVPVFADPLAWDITKNYDALTIVQYNNDTYTSRKAVPSGTAITNTEYWVKTGNYNAQLQEYIEVASEAAEKADELEATMNETKKHFFSFVNYDGTAHEIAEGITVNIDPIDLTNKTRFKIVLNIASARTGNSNVTTIGEIRYATAMYTELITSLPATQRTADIDVSMLRRCNITYEFYKSDNGWEYSAIKVGSFIKLGETDNTIGVDVASRVDGNLPDILNTLRFVPTQSSGTIYVAALDGYIEVV